MELSKDQPLKRELINGGIEPHIVALTDESPEKIKKTRDSPTSDNKNPPIKTKKKVKLAES